MTIDEILKKVHRKFSKDIDYPEAGSEDLMVRLDHVDDAISEWEDLVFEGYAWKELMTNTALVLSGTGTDTLPTDFLSFIRLIDSKSEEPTMGKLIIGGTEWNEVLPGEGEQASQAGFSPAYIFWNAGGNFRTLPAMDGTITLPYLKKATRYTTGAETDEPEMANHKFIENYAVAKVFLDNADDTLYQSFMTSAGEELKNMKYNAIV